MRCATHCIPPPPPTLLARYKTEFDTDRLREEVEQIHSARHRDIVVGVCVLAVVVLAAVAIHRRRMRRYRAEMLALIRDVEKPLRHARTGKSAD